MTPILYNSNETQFNSMGIGVLTDTISAHVVEERNGMFELEMVYPVSGPLYGEIQKDRLIKAKANDDANMEPQLFRIYSINRSMDNNGRLQVNVKAKHISYDLFYNPIKKFSITGNAQAMLDAILSNTMYPHNFTGMSDDQTTASSTLEHVSARAALGGAEGSLLDRWRGEFTFDNHLIKFSQNRGTDTGIVVSYGKNLTDAEQEEAIDETYTSIYPYAKVGTGDDEQIIELPEKTIDSEYVGNYAFNRCLTVDLSGEDVTDEASLRSKAQQYLTNNQIGKPKVSLTVSFVNLWQTEEYKDIAPLEHINLCDWVTVRFKKLGIDVKAKVIKTDYDVLLERYITVDLGDPKSNLADDINSMGTSVSTALNAAQQAIQYAGQAIQHADGTWTFYSATEPAGNIRKGSLWYKLVNGDYTEMWRFDGVAWVRILSKDANDALIRANEAMQSASGKAQVWRQAEEPTSGMKENDIWFRKNADNTETLFKYDGTQWVNPIDSGVKAAQDRADNAVARADAATAQATSAAQDAINAVNTSDSARTAAQAAQQTASDAYNQASTAWNDAQTAISDAQTALDAYNNLRLDSRNYLLGTADPFSKISTTMDTQDTTIYSIAAPLPDVFNVNDDLIIVFDWEASEEISNGYLGIFFENSPWLATGMSGDYPVSGTKGTVIEKGKMSDAILNSASDNVRARIRGINSGITITLKNVRMLKANKDSGWSPALEDTQVQIDNLGEEIGTKVSQTDFNSLSGTVSTQGTQISQNQRDIELKADQTTVDTLSGRVDSQGATISAHTDQIALKASQSSVDTLTGRVSTAESTLTTQANQIAARITEQDADSRYATQTALTATSNSLTSQISSVQTDFDNMQIGGRNLLRNTRNPSNLDHWIAEENVVGFQTHSFYHNGGERLFVIKNTSSHENYMASQRYNVEHGGTYTFSMVGFHNIHLTNFDIYFLGRRKGETDSFTIVLNTSNHILSISEALPFTWTFNIPEDCYEGYIRIDNDGTKVDGESSELWVTELKLEKGTKATDWSPAPEDMATAAQFTSLSQTLTGFQTTVQQDYATKSMVTQTATVLQSSIDGKVGTDTYNSKISQLSNDINLRVSKNDVVNQINISTEGILIDGDKVHITGQTTIDNAVIKSAMIAAVDAGKITTGTLSAQRIGAGAITADKLDVTNLAAISANLGTVTAGTINGVDMYTSRFTAYGKNKYGQSMHVIIADDATEAPLKLLSNAGSYSNEIGDSNVLIKEFDNEILKSYAELQNGYLRVGNISNTTVSVGESRLEGNSLVMLDTSGAERAAIVDGQLRSRQITFYGNNGHISTGSDYAGLDTENNIKLQTFNGFSIAPTVSGFPVPQYAPAFSVSARYGNTYIKNGLYCDHFYARSSSTILSLRSDNGVRVINYANTAYRPIAASAFDQSSRWDQKENFTEIDPQQALMNIINTDVVRYNYKGSPEQRVGLIIDDRESPVYHAASDFVSMDKQFKKDDCIVAELMLSVKALNSMHQQDLLKIAGLEQRISLLEGAAA